MIHTHAIAIPAIAPESNPASSPWHTMSSLPIEQLHFSTPAMPHFCVHRGNRSSQRHLMTGVHTPFCAVDMHVAIMSILALHIAVHSANGAAHCCCAATRAMTRSASAIIVCVVMEERAMQIADT
jgi:hypothetical protein